MDSQQRLLSDSDLEFQINTDPVVQVNKVDGNLQLFDPEYPPIFSPVWILLIGIMFKLF